MRILVKALKLALAGALIGVVAGAIVGFGSIGLRAHGINLASIEPGLTIGLVMLLGSVAYRLFSPRKPPPSDADKPAPPKQ